MEGARVDKMGAYESKPKRFLTLVHEDSKDAPGLGVYCAGFELDAWRCDGFARHLFEWLPEYALPEAELSINHANAFVKLEQAAIRVYKTDKTSSRGEIGEIALHAICRDFFGTIPISARVFYKSTANDVIKAFDMVHAKIEDNGEIQVWLGESKFYSDASTAISAAIASIEEHIDHGFLTQQKIILGPQIPKSTPSYDAIVELFEPNTSLNDLISAAVFPVAILAPSAAVASSKVIDAAYKAKVETEIGKLAKKIVDSGLTSKLKILLIYVPLGDKGALVTAFDKRLKALQP